MESGPTDVETHLAAVRPALEDLGFERLELQRHFAANTELYRHPRSTADAEYYLALEFKPRLVAFGLSVGVANRHAMQLLLSQRAVVESFVSSELVRSGFLDSPCWTFLNAGRALRWDLFAIPAPNEPQLWRSQLEQFDAQILAPRILTIKSAEQVLDLLLSNDDPLVWWAGGSAVLRAAQVIALGMVAALKPYDVRSRLSPFTKVIEREMQGQQDARLLITAIESALRRVH